MRLVQAKQGQDGKKVLKVPFRLPEQLLFRMPLNGSQHFQYAKVYSIYAKSIKLMLNYLFCDVGLKNKQCTKTFATSYRKQHYFHRFPRDPS